MKIGAFRDFPKPEKLAKRALGPQADLEELRNRFRPSLLCFECSVAFSLLGHWVRSIGCGVRSAGALQGRRPIEF